MNPLTRNQSICIGILMIVAYCWLSNDDYNAEQDSAVYTAEIMQKAKEDALADARFNRLREQADDMLALREVK